MKIPKAAEDAIHLGLYAFLFCMYLILPLGEAEVSVQIVSVAIVSIIFISLDVRRSGAEINYAANGCMIATFFMLLGTFLWLAVNESPQFLGDVSNWYKRYGIALAITCLGGAIVEEIAFRRYIQAQLERIFSKNFSLFVSAIMFMFAHGYISISLFIAGVALGIMATHLGSIHAAILIHTTTNVFGAAGGQAIGNVDSTGYSSALVLAGSSALAEIIAIALLFIFMATFTLYKRWRQ